jgi:hypothetical protein
LLGRSILLVAQISPPSNVVAARRVAGLAKYLSRLGHSITVLTSRRSGEGAVEGAVATVRTADLAASGLNWRRSSRGFSTGDAPTGAAHGIEAHVIPDMALVTWLPFCLPRARSLVAANKFDCVITTSPPASTHVVGWWLRRSGIRWIADFRDGWTFDPQRAPWPMAWERRLDERLESSVLRRTDMVFGVTRPLVQDLRMRLGADARLLSNGYDPENDAEIETASVARLVSAERHSLVHTGRAGIAGRSPAAVLEAVRILLTREPDLAERLEIVFAGSLSAEEHQLLADPALLGTARAVGTLPHPQALALQRVADSLLLLPVGWAGPSVATGKLFEYLTAGPPILVIGKGSEAARIVRETGTGIAADEPPEIAAAIARLIGGFTTCRQPEEIGRYSWELLGRRASDLVEEACGHQLVGQTQEATG